MVGFVGEIGEEPDDRVGVQQLRQAEIGALVALEVEPALFTLAGGDQDHAAVVHRLVVDRQRVGRRDTGALAVAHGARHADKDDALEPGVAEGVQPPAEGSLVHKGGDLRAQPAQPRQLRLDERPVIEHIELGQHRDGPIVVLGDHPRDHHVLDSAVETRFRGNPRHFARLFHRILGPALHIGRHQLERNSVEGHSVAPDQDDRTTIQSAAV